MLDVHFAYLKIFHTHCVESLDFVAFADILAPFPPSNTVRFGPVQFSMRLFAFPSFRTVKSKLYHATLVTPRLGYKPELDHTIKMGLDPLQSGDWTTESSLLCDVS